jgi:D-alanyl-D-alanine carboxypeptidase
MLPARRLALAPLLVLALLVPGVAQAAGPRIAPVTDGATAVRVAPAAQYPPLPECRYVDIMTRYRKYADWKRTLVDTNLRLGKGYRPPDLVSVSNAGIEGSGQLRAIVIDDLRAMARAARKAGAGIAIRSAFRSYSQQVAVFNGWVAKSGYQQALLYSARPGHSEHQLGTTADFRSASSATPPWGYSDWATTKSGRWMQQNAWKYGWVLSYPKGKQKIVCYGYEPWHWRYVGRELAAEIRESGLPLRTFLWRRFESK